MTKYRIPVRITDSARRIGPVRAAASAAAPRTTPLAPVSASSATATAETAAAEAAAVEAAAVKAAVLWEGDSDQVPAETRETAEAARKDAEIEAPETEVIESPYRSSELQEWRDRALRLQAEMDNYRRRQRRIARDEARRDQDVLLQDVLAVADNLDRTLAASAAGEPGREPRPRTTQTVGQWPVGTQAPFGRDLDRASPDSLTQGVELTRSGLQRLLAKHGLQRIQAQGRPFDPRWHEAVHVVPAQTLGVEPGTVVQVLQAGYAREDALFRPAKVVVAQ